MVEILIADYQNVRSHDKGNRYAAGVLAVLGNEAEFLRDIMGRMENLVFDG